MRERKITKNNFETFNWSESYSFVAMHKSAHKVREAYKDSQKRKGHQSSIRKAGKFYA